MPIRKNIMVDVNTFPPSFPSTSHEHSVKGRAITYVSPRRIQFSRDTSHRVSEDATSVSPGATCFLPTAKRAAKYAEGTASYGNSDKVSEEADLG